MLLKTDTLLEAETRFVAGHPITRRGITKVVLPPEAVWDSERKRQAGAEREPKTRLFATTYTHKHYSRRY